MTLKEAMYISLRGYGPTSPFTLATWLEANELFRNNREKALKLVAVKEAGIVESKSSRIKP